LSTVIFTETENISNNAAALIHYAFTTWSAL